MCTALLFNFQSIESKRQPQGWLLMCTQPALSSTTLLMNVSGAMASPINRLALSLTTVTSHRDACVGPSR
jgi:hypothetical protein